MHTQISRLAAGLIACAVPACAVPAWAAASTELPTHETYSAAADGSSNLFNVVDPAYTPQIDVTTASGETAQISGADYTAAASTTLGSNHAYTSASTMPSDVLSAGSFSGWYDQVTITGGSGTGTAYFAVQLTGTVDVGALAEGVSYALGTSSVHPSQLTSDLLTFNALSSTQSWPMDAVNPIATYLLGASPYDDTSILFSSTPASPSGGIPIIEDPSLSLGDAGLAFPAYDLVLTPGAGQNINITLHGTLNFTYGEAFYLIGGLGTSIANLASFCTFNVDGTCTSPPIDGTGATTLDFSNSANLVNIALPEGATASFASGTTYNVTAVPEPGEWLMLLAGLGLVGWRVRRKAT